MARLRKSGTARPVALLLLTLLALSCRGPRQNMDPGPSPTADGFSLMLTNHNLLDVNVFVFHDGQADRVATVPASSSRLLALPLWMLGQSKAIKLIAEPIGADTRYTTDLLSVQPGQIVRLTVETPLDRSNYSME
jgi:hypothetical protein